jgi:ABC-type transport system involved in Fe-S cluster assembly fused permease/ATPase subunit
MAYWTVSRFLQAALIESTRLRVAKFVHQGIRNLYRISFEKLLNLDIGYHKSKSKNTAIEINKALKSLEIGLFHLLSDTAKHFVEFLFIGTALFKFCGPKYFLIFLSSFVTYSYATYRFTK